MKYSIIGWNGFLFKIPEEAHFATESGDFKNGYMRFESEDYFFGIKWEEMHPKKKRSVDEVASAFLKKVEKKLKKRKASIQAKKKIRISEHNALSLSVKSEMNECIYFMFCEKSQRMIILNFGFKDLLNFKEIMKEVLLSFRCHSEELNQWSILGFSFSAPQSFLLVERSMMVGRTTLLLREQKITPLTESRKEILFEYFSTANVRFEKEYRDMERWTKKVYFKDLKKRYKKIKFKEVGEEEVNGHHVKVNAGSRISGILTKSSSIYKNVSWYCEEQNRIYSVTISEQLSTPFFKKKVIDREKFEELARQITSSIKCH